MALLTCPDCGNKVSSKAAKCPHCGCPVSVMIQEEQKTEKKQEPEQQVDESVQNMATERSSFEGTQILEPEQPKIEQKQNVGNAEIINDNVKWLQGALFSGVLIAVIVISIYFYKQPSKDNDYTNAQYEPHNTETITSTTTPAKIHNPAEAKLRLNDFQKKITSAPFENGAVEIVKVIDNDYAKCIVFLSNILYYNAYIANAEEGGEDKITSKVCTLFLYDAANDDLYEFSDDHFVNYDVNQLPHKKNYYEDYNHYEFSFDEGVVVSYYKMLGYESDNIFHNDGLVIADYSTNNFLIIQESSQYNGNILKINLSNFTAKKMEGKGTIYEDKYIVIPNSGNDGYKVIDLYSDKEIENPFWTPGTYSLYGKDYEFDLTVFNNGQVTGKCVMEGHEYNLDGSLGYCNVIGNGVIHLPFTYFFIQKKANRFFLYEIKSLEERYGPEYDEYATIGGSKYGYTDEYAYSFFDHKAENIKSSDIKKTTELYQK
ncbi:MAG: zinc ribbon domain-containing protein [Bacteroidales bacterium]|nr:zinc ribbon domain-containing protein [Bacteroidales bacterium]